MDATTIQRYQPGGDIFNKLATAYGFDDANAIAAAARTGSETNVTAAIASAKYGKSLNDSTASIFLDQITTNPLAAPLESANRITGNSIIAFLKSPWVIFGVVVVVFSVMGGWQWLGRKVFKA